MSTRLTLIAALGLALLAPGLLRAQAVYTTDFNNETPGLQADDVQDMSFQLPGAVRSISNPSYYVAGSNRFWGFFGQNSAQVRIGNLGDQSTQASEVTLTLRGTQDFDISNLGFLDDADISLRWYDENDLVQTVDIPLSIPNNAFLTFTIDASNLTPESSISRIEIINGATSNAFYAVLGEIAYTEFVAPVPEPSGALLVLGTFAVFLRRRR